MRLNSLKWKERKEGKEVERGRRGSEREGEGEVREREKGK